LGSPCSCSGEWKQTGANWCWRCLRLCSSQL